MTIIRVAVLTDVYSGTATITVGNRYSNGQNTMIEYSSVLDRQFHQMKQKETRPPKDYTRVPPRKLKK
jgi:hypothetical protein